MHNIGHMYLLGAAAESCNCVHCSHSLDRLPFALIDSYPGAKYPKFYPRDFIPMIRGNDTFHEDDDNILLEGLDDDDDISTTIPDASILHCMRPLLLVDKFVPKNFGGTDPCKICVM